MSKDEKETPKKKSFLVSVGFLKDDETSSKTEETETSPVSTISNQPSIDGVIDEKFVKMLEKVIEDNNIPGQDYFEFKQSIEAMANLPIDEKNKFLTTYTIFSQQGCDKKTLISSIEKYISIIRKEEENFNKEMVSQYNERVQKPMSEVDKVTKEIEELNKQIAEKNNFIITTKQTIQQEDMKIKITDSNFKKSVEKVIDILQSDKEKINTHIQ